MYQLFQIISPEDQVRYMFLLNESNFRERFPGCTKEMRRNKQGDEIRKTREEKTEREEVADDTLGEIETVTGILDIKNVGLMGFWKVKDMLGRVIHISDVRRTSLSNVKTCNDTCFSRWLLELLSRNVQSYGKCDKRI